ncbi:hypothetical protein NL676_031358 [Syzygium grande]|nr:hypothetical protein NL676_031358 [Syzygium grande]
MPSDTSEHRPARPQVSATAGGGASLHHPPPPPQAEALPCPRCYSTNTKFCCYNNYNLSQPRHFCKSHCRYWTQCGTLRNVPDGGGSRKSAAAGVNPPRQRGLAHCPRLRPRLLPTTPLNPS